MPTRTGTDLPHEFAQAVAGSYDNSRLEINQVIIHTMAGTLDSCIRWFQNGNRASMSSAHYGIGFSGRIVQFVDESKTAYHAGNYPINQCSIGIEHEDLNKPYVSRPDALYEASAKLVCDICRFYGIPIDRAHIKKHSEVSKKVTECPAALDIERIVKMANEIATGEPMQTYQMYPSQFVGLVSGSRNFDDFVAVFNSLVPDNQKLLPKDPESGKRAGEYIKYYQTAYNEMAKMLSEAKTTPTNPPQTAATTSTPQFQPPAAIEIDKATYDKAKMWFISDVIGVFRHFITWLEGK